MHDLIHALPNTKIEWRFATKPIKAKATESITKKKVKQDSLYLSAMKVANKHYILPLSTLCTGFSLTATAAMYTKISGLNGYESRKSKVKDGRAKIAVSKIISGVGFSTLPSFGFGWTIIILSQSIN